jgi:hypothetical protein
MPTQTYLSTINLSYQAAQNGFLLSNHNNLSTRDHPQQHRKRNEWLPDFPAFPRMPECNYQAECYLGGKEPIRFPMPEESVMIHRLRATAARRFPSGIFGWANVGQAGKKVRPIEAGAWGIPGELTSGICSGDGRVGGRIRQGRTRRLRRPTASETPSHEPQETGREQWTHRMG